MHVTVRARTARVRPQAACRLEIVRGIRTCINFMWTRDGETARGMIAPVLQSKIG